MTTPSILLPYQQSWIQDSSPVKVWEKSRRIGASWCEAADDALYAASEEGADVWYIGYDKEMAREFIEDCAFWAGHYQLAAAEMEEDVFKEYDPVAKTSRDILIYRVRFASGNEIVALSSAPRGLRGKQGRVVIDEAAFHPDLPELLKSAMALLMWGGRVRILSTHNGDDNPFNELIGDVRAGKRPYSLHRTDIEEALAKGLYERICLKLGRDWSPEGQTAWREELFQSYGDDAGEELQCVPAQGSGAYLSRALIEARTSAAAPVVRLAFDDEFTRWPIHLREAEVADFCERELLPLLKKLNPQREHAFGEDFGRVADLTVLAPLEIGLDLVRRCPFLVELRNTPFDQQRQIVFYILDRLPRFLYAAFDALGNGSYLAEVAMQRYGERVEEVSLSETWYREQMPPFQAAFQDAGIVIPADAFVVDDLRAIKKIKGVAKVPDVRTTDADKKSKRHGDAAIALALAHYASRQDAVIYEYHSVRPGEDDDPAPRGIGSTAGFGRHKGAM